MSASSKKKLRNENAVAKLTERQQAEQNEAKKIKIYTITFVAVLALLIVVAVYSGITRSIESSGMHEKNTVAATVGEHSISNAELSYYYMDAVNNFNNNYGEYAFLYGVDPSVPLDKQVNNEETGETWADTFIQQAVMSAQSCYALADAAKADGFTLPADQQVQLDTITANLDAYATMYGYSDADAFLKAQYGNGADKKSYSEYVERNLIASAYQNAHQDGITFTDEQIREADSKNPAAYSSFNYNQYYLATSKFLTGGTTDENGNTTYTDEERTAAVVAAEAAAASLVESDISSVEDFDAAIAALPVNEGNAAASSAYTNRQNAINSYLTDWVTDPARQEGDITSIPVKTTSTDENGNEVENITAFYVVYFRGIETNEVNLVNVRHILVTFSGDTNEDGSYTDEAKASAKATAEEILNEWKNGDATEESFAALANERSTDSGSNTNGGLYENVYPGQMVAAFNDWCFDASRTAGDTDIVETNYGYHVMYFVGQTEQTYRDYLIVNDLTAEAMENWYNTLIDNCPIVNGDTKYIKKDIIMAR